MTTMPLQVTGGVDTHLDVHVAAALTLVVPCSLLSPSRPHRPATASLLGWLRGFGEVELVGVEGTGSYGAGLTRHLHSGGGRATNARWTGTARGVMGSVWVPVITVIGSSGGSNPNRTAVAPSSASGGLPVWPGAAADLKPRLPG